MTVANIWNVPNVKVGGIVIEFPSSLQFSQTYKPVGGFTDLRMGSGRGVRQTYWTRIETTLTAEGMVPSGLSLLDLTAPQEIACAVPMTVSSETATILLPSNRRTEASHAPFALAVVGGFPVPTSVEVVGDTASAVEVADADSYIFGFYPKFVAIITPSESVSRETSMFRWEITAIEV